MESRRAVCRSNVTFSAAASGSPAPTVQWQVSTDGGITFNDIAGATSPTLTFSAGAADDGKEYRARFSNLCVANVASSAATLTLDSGPLVTRSEERRGGKEGRSRWTADH